MDKDDQAIRQQAKQKGRDLRHVMKSERSRGTRRPRDVKSIELEEAVRRIYAQFCDPGCSRDRFVEVIRALGQPDESGLIRNLLKAFDDRHR